jgi:starvation-inducible DNA-binding protein
MFDSPTPRPEAIRAAGAELLGPLVLNGKALLLAVHFAHVNTRGKAFGPIHAILGEVYDALTTFTDDLAERIATLGGTAPGTLEQVAAGATLTPYPVKTVQDFDHVREVYSRLATWNAMLDEAFNRVTEMGLTADANLLADTVQATEKLGWKLVAHLG